MDMVGEENMVFTFSLPVISGKRICYQLCPDGKWLKIVSYPGTVVQLYITDPSTKEMRLNKYQVDISDDGAEYKLVDDNRVVIDVDLPEEAQLSSWDAPEESTDRFNFDLLREKFSPMSRPGPFSEAIGKDLYDIPLHLPKHQAIRI